MSSSSKRLAMVVAAGHHTTATASDPNNQQMSLKSASNRSTHVNLILASFFLGSVLVVSCMCMCMNYCCKTKMRRRSSSNQGKMLHIPPDSPNLDSSIYTLQGECPYRMQYCEASMLPPYRRPPTPGPPPAYESVVSKHSKYRKFGENDEYSDDSERRNEIKYYLVGEESDSLSPLNKLRHCKIDGNCSLFEEERSLENEIVIPKRDIDDPMKENKENEEIHNAIFDEQITTVGEESQSSSGHSVICLNNIKDDCSHTDPELQSTSIAHEDVKITISEEGNTTENHANCSENSEAQCDSTTRSALRSLTEGMISIVIQEDDSDIDQVLPSYEDALIMASKRSSKQ